MSPQIATYVFILVGAGLFWLDRDPQVPASKTLLLPLVWLWLNSSRSLTEWAAIMGLVPKQTGTQGEMYAEGSPLDRNVLICLIILSLIVLVRRGRLSPLWKANYPVLAFLLYAGLSTMWSDFPDITIRRWLKTVGCVLMIMVVLSERDRNAAVRRLFVWAGFLLIPHSILLIKYYPAIGRAYNRWTWIVSYTGVTTHKNQLGGICEIYGIAFLWHFLAAYGNRHLLHRKRHLIAHGAALVMVVYLFWLANSVTAQSSFLLAAVFLVASRTRMVVRNRMLVHVLILILVAAPFATLFLGVGGGALNSMGRDSTLTGRTDIWTRVIALTDNPMLGAGFESFWLGRRLVSMTNYQRDLNESHNGYLEMWINLGWIGVMILGAIIVKGYRTAISSFRQNPEEGRFRLAFFLTIIVSSFTEAAFRTDGISLSTFLLMAMATPAIQLKSNRGGLSYPPCAEAPRQIQPAAMPVGFRRQAV